MAFTCPWPATQARAPRRTTFTMPSAIASASRAAPRATIGQLDRPSPNTITNTANVPSTAATSLRAGATGRPVWFATVDPPFVPVRLWRAGGRGKVWLPRVAAGGGSGTDRLTSRVSTLGGTHRDQPVRRAFARADQA